MLVSSLAFLALSGAALDLLPEFFRASPAATPPAAATTRLAGARGAYLSTQLLVRTTGDYSLAVEFPAPLQTELFRQWFHFLDAAKSWQPDALVPVAAPYRGRIPDPDNRIPGQAAQAFWVDVWVPADTPPGVYRGKAVLEAGGERVTVPIDATVRPAVVPPEDVVTIDHNSYGTNWLTAQYGAGDVIPLIHQHHRIFYEHRGVFHQLGYGHGGKTAPEFAPVLAGTGRNRRVADWSLYDRHYGPLLDGSAFSTTRRGPRPIPFVYLPVNPEWPASFLWWGEPGYEAEFVNVVSEMERHFREKGWTGTRFELFFNHKKRYKAFPWDGDETRFPEDYRYFVEYARLLRKAVPAASPVKFVFRTDASWSMERQFKELAGVINFWACGGGMFAWYESAARALKDRGDIVWIYGGTPTLARTPVEMTLNPLRTWMMGIDGYIHWLTVDPGPDPWFHSDGGGTALVYPGTRFGIHGPIPSIRLKLQRNALQDIALLARSGDRAEVALRYNGTTPHQWWTPRPPLADGNPWEWNNTDIGEAPNPNQRFVEKLDADAWLRVRQYALEVAR